MARTSPSHPFSKRSLGQNFLTDPNYIRKIIEAVDPHQDDNIVEIGPGRGALTGKLVASRANVIAVELDRALVQILRETYAESANFTVLEQDVLETEFSVFRNANSKFENQNFKLVANLPYYISTAILQKLAAQREGFAEMVLMFQKEVVNRITAEPGNSERGFLTVIVEAAFHVEKLFDVPPNAFSPRPKIWSSVVRLIPKPKSGLDEDSFVRLVSAAFAHKRKTLLNNLKASYPEAANGIESSGIDITRRAETLTLEEWSKLHASLVQS